MEQNGFVENFIGRLRDDCLNELLFAGLNHARRIIEGWWIDPNTRSPRTSLNWLAPQDYDTPVGRPPERLHGSKICPVAVPVRRADTRTNSLYDRGQ